MTKLREYENDTFRKIRESKIFIFKRKTWYKDTAELFKLAILAKELLFLKIRCSFLRDTTSMHLHTDKRGV